ncbi:hypothetical protein [uncultured Microbacterium sp.]|uniref:hypothetical protein n=1 Tax=uncultured Microbacterium sp. TaxID=191216 RepID=UPI0025D3C214|nr:hypothetical protein [uncultured Microbacterium sp.]
MLALRQEFKALGLPVAVQALAWEMLDAPDVRESTVSGSTHDHARWRLIQSIADAVRDSVVPVMAVEVSRVQVHRHSIRYQIANSHFRLIPSTDLDDILEWEAARSMPVSAKV